MTLGNERIDVDEVLPASPVPKNVCLDYVPAWTTDDEIMDSMVDAPIRLPNGQLESDRTPFISTAGHVELLKAVHTSIVHSRMERNAADFATQSLVYDGAVVLAETEDAHGWTVPATRISVAGAEARGIFVVMPAQTGQSALVGAVERFIGTKSHNFYVHDRDGEQLDVNLVESITVAISPTGSPKRFWRTVLRKFADASGETYSGTTGPFFREAPDAAVAMSALGLKHHLGALIVTGLNSRVMAMSSTEVLLGELAEFTGLSGIPVICFATTGAVPRLIAMGEAVAPLYSRGGFSIPALRLGDAQWGLLASHVWEQFIGWIFKHPEPAWFANELWQHTLGRADLVMKLARFIYNARKDEKVTTLDKELLAAYAVAALKIERAPLKALLNAKNASRDGAIRYADWLSIESNTGAIPAVHESFSGTFVSHAVGGPA